MRLGASRCTSEIAPLHFSIRTEVSLVRLNRGQGNVAERQSSLELLRVVSAAGIVWFHAGVTGSQVGYIGLSVFLILTPLFELGPNASRIVAWKQHAKRLLIPFAFWSIIYLAANAVKGKPLIQQDHGLVLGLLSGPAIHLWYLPFMAAALGVTNALKTWLKPPTIAAVATGLLLPLLVLHHFYRGAAEMAGTPIPQWFHALTPVILGMICGASRHAIRNYRWIAALMLLAILLLWREVSVAQFLAGFALVEVSGAIKWRNDTVNFVAGAMMGVYLVHPLALTVFRMIEPYSQPAFVLAAFGASTVGVLIFARIAPAISAALLGTPNRKKHKVADS